jgi:hypothetical protein
MASMELASLDGCLYLITYDSTNVWLTRTAGKPVRDADAPLQGPGRRVGWAALQERVQAVLGG